MVVAIPFTSTIELSGPDAVFLEVPIPWFLSNRLEETEINPLAALGPVFRAGGDHGSDKGGVGFEDDVGQKLGQGCGEFIRIIDVVVFPSPMLGVCRSLDERIA